MSKLSTYRYHIIPLLAFVCLIVLLMRGLFLEPQAIPSVKLNKVSPKFRLSNLMDGHTLDQSILRGKWTILNVWASWCEACAIEHPFLLQLSKQGINLVGLNYKDEAEAAQAWLDNYGNPYQAVLYDHVGDVAIDFGVYGSPETFLIDKQGIIRHRHIGILTHDEWQRSFLPLMDDKST